MPEILDAAPRKVVGTTVLLGSLAVAATGLTIGTGVAGSAAGTAQARDLTNPEVDSAASDSTAAAASDEGTPDAEATEEPELGHPSAARLSAASAVRRQPTLSRSADRRSGTDPVKAAALSAEPAGEVDAGSKDLSQADPREIARTMLPEFGFGADQFGCLDSLYTRESGWNVSADNPSSSAYGIPQSLPGEKMASAGADWATNPVTQIRWGLGYIRDSYGSPCGAWAHSEATGWY
jgi:hypothetical protein